MWHSVNRKRKWDGRLEATLLITCRLSVTGKMLCPQVRHRTRTWRHGRWCGTCRTVIGWRGLRTAEASCSGWYPDAGTPIQTAGRNSRPWGGTWRSCSRTIWTDITWTSRASPPSALTDNQPREIAQKSSRLFWSSWIRREPGIPTDRRS